MSTANPAPIGPVPDIEPSRPGGVRAVTDEDDLEAMRKGVESGLLSGSEALLHRSLRPVSRGAGRDRDRR
jgi:hypothetical protein